MPRRGPIGLDARGPVKDAERQNLLDNTNGFPAALDTIIRLPVIWEALFVQSTKTGFVPEEWPVSHQYTALQQDIDCAIEPHDGDTRTLRGINIVDQSGVPGLRKCPAPQREDRTRVPFRCPAKHARETFMFDVAKHRFALLLENLRNWQAGVPSYFVVEIDTM